MVATKKSYPLAEFKALPSEDGQPQGKFSARVAVYNNVDLAGDRVMPTAFDASIAEWKASGDPIPVVWSHDWADPFAHIGFVNPSGIKSSEAGLEITDAQLDVETNPFAKQVYDLLAQRRIKEFSFAYDVRDEALAKDGANNLNELGIIEVGPTLKGMNPETELVGVKAALEAAANEKKLGELETMEARIEEMKKSLVVVPEVEIETKAGARHSAADSQRIDALHTMVVELGYGGCIEAPVGDDGGTSEGGTASAPKANPAENQGPQREEPRVTDELRVRALLAGLDVG